MASLMNPSSFSHDDLTQLFNLQNDMIEKLDVKQTSSSVEVYIALQRDEHECPVCGSKTNKVKAYTTKKILHSLLTNYPCNIMDDKYHSSLSIIIQFRYIEKYLLKSNRSVYILIRELMYNKK